MILDGHPDGTAFRAWVEKVPVSEPRRDDVVVCDRLSVHRIAGIRDIIEAAGADLRCLLPSSLDLNPVEMAFSRMKSLIRKVAARTKAKLRRATAWAIDLETPENTVKYHTSCDCQGVSAS